MRLCVGGAAESQEQPVCAPSSVPDDVDSPRRRASYRLLSHLRLAEASRKGGSAGVPQWLGQAPCSHEGGMGSRASHLCSVHACANPPACPCPAPSSRRSPRRPMRARRGRWVRCECCMGTCMCVVHSSLPASFLLNPSPLTRACASRLCSTPPTSSSSTALTASPTTLTGASVSFCCVHACG